VDPCHMWSTLKKAKHLGLVKIQLLQNPIVV
jgi:hypothetical protein